MASLSLSPPIDPDDSLLRVPAGLNLGLVAEVQTCRHTHTVYLSVRFFS